MKKFPLLLLFISIFFSCADNSSQLIKSEGGKGITPIQNKIPPGGCPNGYIWDNSNAQCVPDIDDPIINDKGDIAISSITFFPSKSTEGPIPSPIPGWTQKLTPGVTIKGKAYSKLQLFNQGQPTNEILIVGIKSQNGYVYTDYYDRYGKRFGQLTNYTNNTFKLWKPSFMNDEEYVLRGFAGQWGKCVGILFNQMTDGTVFHSVFAIGCGFWGGVCAGAIGTYCVIAANVLEY